MDLTAEMRTRARACSCSTCRALIAAAHSCARARACGWRRLSVLSSSGTLLERPARPASGRCGGEVMILGVARSCNGSCPPKFSTGDLSSLCRKVECRAVRYLVSRRKLLTLRSGCAVLSFHVIRINVNTFLGFTEKGSINTHSHSWLLMDAYLS